MHLFRPTETKRRTTMPTGRVLLHPIAGQPDVSPGSYRRILIVLPESPAVSIAIGPMRLTDASDIVGIDDAGAYPEDIADGREYQWPAPLSAGGIVKIHLMPEQWISAMSHDGIAEVTLYVEYIEP